MTKFLKMDDKQFMKIISKERKTSYEKAWIDAEMAARHFDYAKTDKHFELLNAYFSYYEEVLKKENIKLSTYDDIEKTRVEMAMDKIKKSIAKVRVLKLRKKSSVDDFKDMKNDVNAVEDIMSKIEANYGGGSRWASQGEMARLTRKVH